MGRWGWGILNFPDNIFQHLSYDVFVSRWILWICKYSFPTVLLGNWAPFQYPIRRHIVRSCEVSKLQDLFLKLSHHSNLTGTLAALLPMCLSNFKAMRSSKLPILWLRDFPRSYDKMSCRILKRGPGLFVHSYKKLKCWEEEIRIRQKIFIRTFDICFHRMTAWRLAIEPLLRKCILIWNDLMNRYQYLYTHVPVCHIWLWIVRAMPNIHINSLADFSDWWLRHLLWNCPNMNVSGPHWWSVNIGSGNGLVPSGNKPLPEPMLTQISVTIWRR